MNAQTEIKASTMLGALAAALPELEGAKKNAANPHFKAKYADLGSVIEAIRPIAQHGLWFRQTANDSENGVSVETFYIREGEELSAGVVFVPADKKNAHGYGSAQTYARRYGLQLAFGLSTEDDDGNAAVKGQKATPSTMSDGTRVKIIQLCEAVGDNQADVICNAYSVGSIADLTGQQADAVVKRLEEKLKAKADA